MHPFEYHTKKRDPTEVNTQGRLINKSVQILAFADNVDIIERSTRKMTLRHPIK